MVNNDRVIQLSNDRLVVPAAYHRAKLEASAMDYTHAFDSRAIALYYLSDDGGFSWRESADWCVLPRRSHSSLQGPGAVELRAPNSLHGWHGGAGLSLVAVSDQYASFGSAIPIAAAERQVAGAVCSGF